MKRREFIATLGGAAAWSLAARAQQQMPVIGLLIGVDLGGHTLDALLEGLKESGFTEGRNVTIEYHSADGQVERLPEQAADLVRRGVAVIVTIAGTAPALAAKAATTSIPIVFSLGGDPVKLGLVSALNRPGGNVTGVSFLTNTLGAKRMELLHTLVPQARLIGLLENPLNPNNQSEIADMETAARAFGQQVIVAGAHNEDEIDAAFAKFVEQRVNAISVVADGFFNSRRERLAALQKRFSIPAVFGQRLFAAAGGLMSYGASITDANRLAGNYVGRILNGEKPADLPVIQSAKFEFVVNLKTAKTLGITVPPNLLALADEVIE
jgi:putative ABC transport system substrate-binding protein